MFKPAAVFAAVSVAILAVSTSAAEPTLGTNKESQRVNILCDYECDQDPAAIWVSDGLEYRRLSAITNAIREIGVTEIQLSVVRHVWDPQPNHKPGDQHVAIRFTEDDADLFVTPRVPLKFIERLCENLLEIDGIDRVRLRATNSGSQPEESAERASLTSAP
ncbi:MAG: hypothetical protein AAF664_23755 [Planctomycetota bacterium]